MLGNRSISFCHLACLRLGGLQLRLNLLVRLLSRCCLLERCFVYRPARLEERVWRTGTAFAFEEGVQLLRREVWCVGHSPLYKQLGCCHLGCFLRKSLSFVRRFHLRQFRLRRRKALMQKRFRWPIALEPRSKLSSAPGCSLLWVRPSCTRRTDGELCISALVAIDDIENTIVNQRSPCRRLMRRKVKIEVR
eukprot:COSAG06_NODE_343_length_17092_cov_17.908021_2_plen_192_part_00